MHGFLNDPRFQGGWRHGYSGEAKKEWNIKRNACVILAPIFPFPKYLSGYSVAGTIPVSNHTSVNNTDNENPAVLNIQREEAANKQWTSKLSLGKGGVSVMIEK